MSNECSSCKVTDEYIQWTHDEVVTVRLGWNIVHWCRECGTYLFVTNDKEEATA